MLLMALVVVAVEWGVVGTLSAASLNKQHSVAAALVSSTTAQVEAIPFNQLELGIDPSWDSSHGASLTSDSNVKVVSGTYELKLDGNATILTSQTCSSSCSDPPLVPHISSVVVGGRTYTVSVYPTATSTSGLVEVVVAVTWRTQQGVTGKVVGELQVAKP